VCHSAVVTLSSLNLPFNDTLDWTEFSVILKEELEILKDTIKDMKRGELERLQNNLFKVK
jgi:hypothetical protein